MVHFIVNKNKNIENGKFLWYGMDLFLKPK